MAANCTANVTANMNDDTKPKISKVRIAVNQAELKRCSDWTNLKETVIYAACIIDYLWDLKKGVNKLIFTWKAVNTITVS